MALKALFERSLARVQLECDWAYQVQLCRLKWNVYEELFCNIIYYLFNFMVWRPFLGIILIARGKQRTKKKKER